MVSLSHCYLPSISPVCSGRAIVISQSPEKLIHLESEQVQGLLMAWAVSLTCLGHQGEGLISQAVIFTSVYSLGDSPMSKCGLTFTLKRPGSIF